MNKTFRKKLIKISVITIVGAITCICVYSTSSNKIIISIKENNPLKIIENRLGDESTKVIDYVQYTLGNLNIVAPIKVKPVNDLKDLNTKDKTEKEIVSEIIKEINKYNYNYLQSNPHLLKTEGGNCQAKSLMFQAYADKYGIENKIVTEPNHMYNVVTLENEDYKVDLVKHKFYKINEN